MPTVNEDLLEACKTCNLSEIKKALEQGAYVNTRDKKGNNGLHIIVSINLQPSDANYQKNINLIEQTINFLLQAGINYKAKNISYETPGYRCSSGLKDLYNKLIEDFEYDREFVTKKLLTEQIELLKAISLKLDNQAGSMNDVMKQLQQPLDFEKQKSAFLEKENQLLQKQLSLQTELEVLRQENRALRQQPVENNPSNKKNTPQIFK